MLLSLSASLLAVAPTAGQQKVEQPPETQPTASQPVSEQGELEEFDDIELLEMEVPVVVTATRREQKITTVPHAISVITAEDIRRSGARSIPDALRLVPGVDVAELAYSAVAVSPRGMHGVLANKTLVLVDGRQIFDAYFGGTAWGSYPFQLEDIERIEVIRGPGGVTWGANAVNGVINIITKDPRDQVGLTFTGGGASRGMHKEHLGYAFADDKFRFRISGEYEASDGYRGGTIFGPMDDEYGIGRMGLYGVYEAGPADTWVFSAGSTIHESGSLQPPINSAVRRNIKLQANYVLFQWRHRLEPDNAFELVGYVNDYFTANGLRSIEYRYEQLALLFNHTFKPAAAHTLSWGVDTRVDLVDATNADPFMLSKGFVATAIVGAYAQDEWRFADRWTLNLGARLDYENYGGFQPSARGSLSYELSENATLYGAVSRAFHMPPAALRFTTQPHAFGLVRLSADRDLKAESLIAYEIGYRGRHFDRLETNLNLFWNEYSDLHTFSPRLGPPGLIRVDIDNRASATIYGLEFDAKYAVTKSLTLLGNYTYQQLDWDSLAPFHETDVITPPTHKFMVGARYSPTDDLHLSTHLYRVGAVKAPDSPFPLFARRIDPYFRLDLRGEYEFWDDRASVAVGVRNLLDPSHPEGGSAFLDQAEVPRMVYGELRLRIK
ncbi:MAG TPA: TonB-dependent receptor [Phycisphaerae bacterium]|nr:TonB-dependent receptor [Phycisphaerae bacterium]